MFDSQPWLTGFNHAPNKCYEFPVPPEGPIKTDHFEGSSAEPVPWSTVEGIFDALISPDRRGLETWPAAPGNVHASWVDVDELMHPVGHLDELRTAYEQELTRSLEFGRYGGDLLTSNFLYAPGARPPTGGAAVSGSPAAVDAATSVVRSAFPLSVGGGVIFLSWSGDVSLAIARTLKEILDRRLGAASNVFLSELSIAPGENPGEVMLERNLRRADALVAVLTEHAAQSPWVIWETAAVWGRRKLLIPIFVDTRPGLVPGPLGQVVQGIKLHQRERLDALTDAAGKPPTDPLTDEEFDALVVAARMIPGSTGGSLIVRLEHRGSQTEIGELTIAAPIVEGVSGATEVMRQIDEAVESELSDFDAQQQVAAAMMSDEAAGPVANYADIRWTPTLLTERLIAFLVEGSYIWPGKANSYQQSAGSSSMPAPAAGSRPRTFS